MGQKKIKLIIVKFLNKEASQDELMTLDLWLRNKKNQVLFNEFVKTEYLISSSMDEFDIEKAKQSVKKKLKTNARKRWIVHFSKYAAAIIIAALISIPFFTKKPTSKVVKDEIVVLEDIIKTGSNKAILTLNNGKEIELKKEETYISGYIKSDGENLIYNNTDDNTEIAYNYLTIPRGGQYSVILSDGTKIWLNSDSKLKYPANFIEGETRIVELVYGEAYLEVSPSSKHDGSKFIVHSKSQAVEVLGTKFNIKVYLEEDTIYTSLAEGSIAVAYENSTKILSPNYQSIININTKNFEVKSVNISEVIAWKNGVFSFKNMPLKDMMTVLNRWYNTSVIFKNPETEKIEFNGVLGKDQDIEDILSIITNSNTIQYDIENTTIIFK
ncbi:FecR family protein [Flavivirga amylovorans]|uniref:FecR family protein n=1 Tax=Flavivirga amylovorans TaxID=870486 RepID=A0ABT8WZY7_9FLAO|nr:FecR family protein [Flavivirga amylovorans]MDO5987067.1 FecR family protein [Flavivirga amylovorans]